LKAFYTAKDAGRRHIRQRTAGGRLAGATLGLLGSIERFGAFSERFEL
jgi:hypothetical protein